MFGLKGICFLMFFFIYDTLSSRIIKVLCFYIPLLFYFSFESIVLLFVIYLLVDPNSSPSPPSLLHVVLFNNVAHKYQFIIYSPFPLIHRTCIHESSHQ